MRGKLDSTKRSVGYLPSKVSLTKSRAGKPPAQPVHGLKTPTVADGQEVPGFAPLVFAGGPILVDVELVSYYWGNFTQQEIASMQSYLQGLAAYLSGTNAPVGKIPDIWQYNAGCARLGTVFSLATTPSHITEQDIQNQMVTLQNQGNLPAFASNRLFLVFTKGISFNIQIDGGNYNEKWCAYHNTWGANEFFAVCPQPLAGGVCGNSMDGWESLTSHEIMEAFTDPSPWTGWNSSEGEGGDVCAWQEAILSFGTIQLFADNNQQACTLWTPDHAYHVSSFNPWPGYAVTHGNWLIGDFNGDGKADIIHLVQDTDYVNVWLSNGDGTFNVASFNPWPRYTISNGQWLVGDFNGDGRADLVHAVDGSDHANTWVSNGDSTFSVAPFSPRAGYAVTNGLWRAGDINGDGKTDIVHAVEGSNYANIWISFLIPGPCQ